MGRLWNIRYGKWRKTRKMEKYRISKTGSTNYLERKNISKQMEKRKCNLPQKQNWRWKLELAVKAQWRENAIILCVLMWRYAQLKTEHLFAQFCVKYILSLLLYFLTISIITFLNVSISFWNTIVIFDISGLLISFVSSV